MHFRQILARLVFLLALAVSLHATGAGISAVTVAPAPQAAADLVKALASSDSEESSGNGEQGDREEDDAETDEGDDDAGRDEGGKQGPRRRSSDPTDIDQNIRDIEKKSKHSVKDKGSKFKTGKQRTNLKKSLDDAARDHSD